VTRYRVFPTAPLTQATDPRGGPFDGCDARHCGEVADAKTLEGGQAQAPNMPSNISERIGATRIPVVREVRERPDATRIQDNRQKSHKAKIGVSAYQKRSLSPRV
jgi:hypothetical protein